MMMKFMLLVFTMTIIFLPVANADAQVPGWCTCFGGSDSLGNVWYLLDYYGYPLEDGDLVYAAWIGSDGEIDPPSSNGWTSDDDIVVWPGLVSIVEGVFDFKVTVWPYGPGIPIQGDTVYCRVFDDSWENINPATYYADSQLYEIQYHVFGEEFYCLFPGDPGGGHTNTPLYTGPCEGFTIYGGLDTTDMSNWPLTDIYGQRLEDGDLVQLILVGPNSTIDTMDELTGMPSGDNSLLVTWRVGHGYEESGTGLFKYDTYAFPADPWEGYLAQGDWMYVRIFDNGAIGEGSEARWYGESDVYQVIYQPDETFYSLADSSFDAVNPAPWYRTITAYGGFDSTMAEYPLTDALGSLLEDGDAVQLIWAGSDGMIDAINEINGLPTGDDSLLATVPIDGGTSQMELQSFRNHGLGMPASGDVLYLRVFNDSSSGLATYYGESDLHGVIYQQGESFFGFPDDAADATNFFHPTIMIYGGIDSTMLEHPLTDSSGAMLEDGDLVQVIWAGPDESVDLISEINGMPTGDDSIFISLTVGNGYGEDTGLFQVELPTFSSHAWGMPANGDVVYLRVFDDVSTATARHYGESGIYTVIRQPNEFFFAFGDDAADAVHPMNQTMIIYGGVDSSMAEHPMTGYTGAVLNRGRAQLIWAGPDGIIDAMNVANGLPSGDDSLLISFGFGIGYGDSPGLFKRKLSTFSNQGIGRPAAGDFVYIRVFNNHVVQYASRYGESEMHLTRHDLLENFFPFPDDADDAVTPNPAYTSVEEWAGPEKELPAAYSLRQNYPNPFNASTEIRYALPAAGPVSLRVYNIRGEKVATLAEGSREVGAYTIRWDPEELASGIYFCRLQAGEYAKTVKMVLLR